MSFFNLQSNLLHLQKKIFIVLLHKLVWVLLVNISKFIILKEYSLHLLDACAHFYVFKFLMHINLE